MNADWPVAISFVLEAEGGYTNDPADPGGETNFGISKKSYPSVDVKSLTLNDATAIYQRDYWQACRCDELPSPLAIGVFDCAVNQGVGKAKRLLQMTLNVAVDGVIGDKTISAAFKSPPDTAQRYLVLRLVEYAKLIAANPALIVFATNWAARVGSLSTLIFKN